MLRILPALFVVFAFTPSLSADPETSKISEMTARVEKLGGRLGRKEGVAGRPVNAVSFSDSLWVPVGGELDFLKDFSPVQTLWLGERQSTDAGIRSLQGLLHITSLSLCNASMTATGWDELRQLKNLTSLSLDATELSDVNWAAMSKMEQLKSLDLSSTQISPAGWTVLKEIPI